MNMPWRHLARSADEWGTEVDSFMDRHFEATMGRMVKSLCAVATIDVQFENLLREVLAKRNWLVHDFFRERATHFMSLTGREQMIGEIDACRDLFQNADQRLEAIVAPLCKQAGITDELLLQEYHRMLAELP